jgi:transcriptional regulator with XRE-family HTH domain
MTSAGDKRLQVAGRLREAREYLGLSQDEVAAALELSRPAITNIESGTRKVDALELEQLAQLYGRTVDYFLGKEEKVPDSKIAFAARTLKGLSDKDLEEVARFAEFLRSSAKKKPGGR